eukprot:TRINITY_DN500_c0_g1_i1.p2 TRINITY_DN500_c0_g1~~TRINITY_DN500_c0_g1_i1.p2  ORF type:complete len:115 (-),score=17.47 TRINITY_DN500_c0_g1_i1:137-481(-)
MLSLTCTSTSFPNPNPNVTKSNNQEQVFWRVTLLEFFCAIVSHPADNLVSKLNKSKDATIGGVIKEMGWYKLFTQGIGLRIIMIGTLTGLQWGIYDAYKVYVGLPTSGGGIQKK